MIPAMTRLSLLLCAALAAAGAQAAGDKLRLGAFGPGKASGPLLSKAELRECLRRMDDIRERNEKLAQDRDTIERDKAELLRQGEELKALRDTLDRSSAEAVDGYNTRVGERERLRSAFDQGVEAFNAKVAALEAERRQFAQRCENRRFDQDDETALRAEMKKGS